MAIGAHCRPARGAIRWLHAFAPPRILEFRESRTNRSQIGRVMSERFFRCPHCRLPHDVQTTLCPATNKPIAVERKPEARGPRPDGRPSVIPGARAAPPVPAAGDPRRPLVEQPIPLVKRAAKGGRYGGVDARGLCGRILDGKYKIQGILGEGGMGTVYEGSHVDLGRAVAIKVLHPNQARKPEAVQRLYQEARSAGSIGHPNICEVYDVGRFDDGSPFLVMERLDGETLADRVSSDGALPFDFVVDVMSQVLSGLVGAHAKGIVHRDIKPENIFLTRRVGLPPVAKILDFGVSKTLQIDDQEAGLDLTKTGMVMGTPYYLSPEQARGERTLDHRVDIWACGVMLYECLIGRRPFIASNYNALLVQILQSSPRPLRELRPATPAGFESVVARALERDREKRYRNATEFQTDLQVLRDRHRPATASIPILTAAHPVQASDPRPNYVPARESSSGFDPVMTPSPSEPSPVIDLKKLAEEDTKVLVKLRSSVRIPAAPPVKPSTTLLSDDDIEEIDIDLEDDADGASRRGRASDAPTMRPPQSSVADDTLYGMNVIDPAIPAYPRAPRMEADDERTQVMDPRDMKSQTDPEITLQIRRKR